MLFTYQDRDIWGERQWMILNSLKDGTPTLTKTPSYRIILNTSQDSHDNVIQGVSGPNKDIYFHGQKLSVVGKPCDIGAEYIKDFYRPQTQRHLKTLPLDYLETGKELAKPTAESYTDWPYNDPVSYGQIRDKINYRTGISGRTTCIWVSDDDPPAKQTPKAAKSPSIMQLLAETDDHSMWCHTQPSSTGDIRRIGRQLDRKCLH